MNPILYCKAAILLLLLAGCASRSPSPRLFVFSLCEQMPTLADAPERPVVQIDPVRIAPYLDRPHLVTRRSGIEIEVRQFERWGTPLDTTIQDLLACTIRQARPDLEIVAARPGFAVSSPHRIRVEILRLDGSPGATVYLVARWRIDPADDTPPREVWRTTTHSVETSDDSIDAYVSAIRETLLCLSEAIASDLRN